LGGAGVPVVKSTCTVNFGRCREVEGVRAEISNETAIFGLIIRALSALKVYDLLRKSSHSDNVILFTRGLKEKLYDDHDSIVEKERR
jgi:hypothetical protein